MLLQTLNRLFLVALAAFLIAGVGCSEGGFGEAPADEGETGYESPDGTSETTDTGTAPPDTAEDDPPDTTDGPDSGPAAAAPIGAFTSCGAGGISSAGEITAVQCFGPVEISGREASGDGVRWKPGAFELVSEGAQ